MKLLWGLIEFSFPQHTIEKFSSGRWIQTVTLTLTYCIVILGCLYLTAKKIIPITVFIALFSGFTSMVVLINEWYFKREDRKQEQNGQAK